MLSRQSRDPALRSVCQPRFLQSLTVIARLGEGLLLPVAVFAGLSGRPDLLGQAGALLGLHHVKANPVVSTIPVGSNPYGVAVTSNGLHAYVTNNSDNDDPGGKAGLTPT